MCNNKVLTGGAISYSWPHEGYGGLSANSLPEIALHRGGGVDGWMVVVVVVVDGRSNKIQLPTRTATTTAATPV